MFWSYIPSLLSCYFTRYYWSACNDIFDVLIVISLGPQGRVNIPINSGAREIATILDTALLQALLLTGQSSSTLELLKGLNYCDVKISEEFLQKGNQYACLLELYKCNAMHREALKLLHKLVEDSKSDQPQTELTQKFKPEMIIEYLKVSFSCRVTCCFGFCPLLGKIAIFI